jgi:hypothetical protein
MIPAIKQFAASVRDGLALNRRPVIQTEIRVLIQKTIRVIRVP